MMYIHNLQVHRAQNTPTFPVQVKYRIAVGLSKEGWAILQNLLTLLCMISLSLLVFNYTMREFCVLALVGVLCDAFLQLVFFTTVLSVDLRRLEVCVSLQQLYTLYAVHVLCVGHGDSEELVCHIGS